MLCKKMVFAGRPSRPASCLVLASGGRAPAYANSRAFSSSLPRNKERLVILGSGWGGYEVLRAIDKERWNVTMISPNNYFNFTPLLASCAVGTLEFRCATEPVRRYSPEVVAYQAWCDHIGKPCQRFGEEILILERSATDRFSSETIAMCTLITFSAPGMPATPPLSFETRSAPKADATTTQFPGTGTPFTLTYDKLVIAVGAYSQTFDVPGVKEHAHFLKDVKDARAIRTRILECFEQANQPTISDVERRKLLNFCIVGGGPTGVEFAAELHDLLHTEMERHYPGLTRFAKISMYDVAPQILGMFDESLVKYAEKTFKRDGISIFTSHHVERVEPGKLFVKEQGEVPFGLLVWSTGLAPNPLVQSASDVKKDLKTSSIITNDHLNVLKEDGTPYSDVWAIGDAAMIEDARLPATAQVANQKAKYLTKKLNRLVKDKDSPKPFEFHNQGSLAYIGNWKAIYDRSGTGNNVMNKETGRLAWLLWRSAYFTMTLSVRNKILVPTYWFLNWIFGRDLTRF
ncbi:hypothetical protein PC9H_000292 [Pleurotus ostreatus]|uniref:FAD/NAD(P)-binding domain-containing protein n=1 Tax=Pleurotus ostreatus TaxID=5322 RepID=A0A8H7DWN2_PLEOS|nr:uncharacterized protein PC9H_000292 [Pleurotus ostreatus]KAF7439955.1 hypothetical protein PC9H_000292 [Pleurotus ostreatus]